MGKGVSKPCFLRFTPQLTFPTTLPNFCPPSSQRRQIPSSALCFLWFTLSGCERPLSPQKSFKTFQPNFFPSRVFNLQRGEGIIHVANSRGHRSLAHRAHSVPYFLHRTVRPSAYLPLLSFAYRFRTEKTTGHTPPPSQFGTAPASRTPPLVRAIVCTNPAPHGRPNA